MYQVNVFISHSWAYSEHYDTLAQWIFKDPWSMKGESINFIDMSVPKDDPIHNAPTDQALYSAIDAKIYSSNVVVIPTGMYANYSKWIKKEIDSAQSRMKSIVGVNPWGQEKKSVTVQENAKEVVGWTKQSVVNAIWKYRI